MASLGKNSDILNEDPVVVEMLRVWKKGAINDKTTAKQMCTSTSPDMAFFKKFSPTELSPKVTKFRRRIKDEENQKTQGGTFQA